MADLPIGSIIMFDGSTLPAGWFDCDGSTHGGIETPNLIGKFPMGVPSGGTLGAVGGASTHDHANLDTGLQTHGHAATNANTGTSSGSVGGIWGGTSYYGLAAHQHAVSIGAVSEQASHKHTMPNTDSASLLPPNISLRYIMRCE